MTQFNTTTLDAQITALEAQVNHAVDYAHDSAQGQALRRNIKALRTRHSWLVKTLLTTFVMFSPT